VTLETVRETNRFTCLSLSRAPLYVAYLSARSEEWTLVVLLLKILLMSCFSTVHQQGNTHLHQEEEEEEEKPSSLFAALLMHNSSALSPSHCQGKYRRGSRRLGKKKTCQSFPTGFFFVFFFMSMCVHTYVYIHTLIKKEREK